MPFKLLIVDDSEQIRNSLSGLIESIPGVDSICTADSLLNALESAEQHDPDFIVLDLHLPDGIAVQRIEGLKWLAPHAQIAVLTNDASEFNRKKCLAAGAGAFFDKSTEFEMLLDVVRHQAAKH
jgi:DNA-binding NarL/FixJ family response regulator